MVSFGHFNVVTADLFYSIHQTIQIFEHIRLLQKGNKQITTQSIGIEHIT